MNNIIVLIKTPGKPAEIREIENTLKTFQFIVGGHIEALRITEDVFCYIHDEGKLFGAAPNLVLPRADCGADIVCGTAIFFRVDNEGKETNMTFTDLIFCMDFCVKFGVENYICRGRPLAELLGAYND